MKAKPAGQKTDYDFSAHRTCNDAKNPVFKRQTLAQRELTPKQHTTSTSTCFIQFALYEAYGTRPYEWGEDPDRQKANTKEEELDFYLLNEGMRYRDLYTGTFLTRDPIGYGDGPNVYCYVHCNPITQFDPLGLKFEAVGGDDFKEETAEELEVAEEKLRDAVSNSEADQRERNQEQLDRFLTMKNDPDKTLYIYDSRDKAVQKAFGVNAKNYFLEQKDRKTGESRTDKGIMVWNPDLKKAGDSTTVKNGDDKLRSGEGVGHEIGHWWDNSYDGSPGIEQGNHIHPAFRDGLTLRSEVPSLMMENSIRYGGGDRNWHFKKEYNNDRFRIYRQPTMWEMMDYQRQQQAIKNQ